MTRAQVCVCAQWLNCVCFFVTPWTVSHQAPLSMEFSRQEYWSGLPFLSPGELPDPGIESVSLEFPALAGRFFTTAPPGSYHQMLSSALWQLQSIPVSLQMVSVLGLTAVHVGESPQWTRATGVSGNLPDSLPVGYRILPRIGGRSIWRVSTLCSAW